MFTGPIFQSSLSAPGEGSTMIEAQSIVYRPAGDAKDG